MTPNWKDRILELKHRTTEAEDAEFVTLVSEATGKCTYEIAKILMLTFTGDQDYGVQECVTSVLASAQSEVRARVLLEELPRLLEEAPKWAEDLVGEEVEFRPLLLASIAKEMSQVVKSDLRRLLTQSSFAKFYPNAEQVMQLLEGE